MTIDRTVKRFTVKRLTVAAEVGKDQGEVMQTI